MQNPSTETASSVPSAELIQYLQGCDNPFSDAVDSDLSKTKSARNFVPEVNQDIFEKLQAALRRYRFSEIFTGEPVPVEIIPRSGVVVVVGKRGAGKTNLVHRLDKDNDCVVVTPKHFSTEGSFSEFLLRHAFYALEKTVHLAKLESGDPAQSALGQLAHWFTRKAMIQCVQTMSATDWLGYQALSASKKAGKGSGQNGTYLRQGELLQKLHEHPGSPLNSLTKQSGFTPGILSKVVRLHVHRTEIDPSTGGRIRAHLYLHLVAAALDPEQDYEPLLRFIQEEFAEVADQDVTIRETQINALLQAIVELFFLLGTPLIFAFDQLETVFKSPPQEELCKSFFAGISTLIESQLGLPIFIFAERDHWRAAKQHLHNYEGHRMDQGIPTEGHGELRDLTMQPVSPEALRKVLEFRMAPLLQRFYQKKGGIPAGAEILPFSDADLHGGDEGDQDRALRESLLTMRNRYEELTSNKAQKTYAEPALEKMESAPAEEPVPPSMRVSELEARWKREQSGSLRKIERSWSDLAAELHSGTQHWLNLLQNNPDSCDGWSLSNPESHSLNHNISYGHYFTYCWQKDGHQRRTALAFLLGTGTGMASDLRKKLEVLDSEEHPVDRLLILWPRTKHHGKASGLLPGKTKEAWDDFVTEDVAPKIRLVAIAHQDLTPLLTIDPWTQSLSQLTTPAEPDEIHKVLFEYTTKLTDLILPAKA